MSDCVEVKKDNGKIAVLFDFQTGKAGVTGKGIAAYFEEVDMDVDLDFAWKKAIWKYLDDNAPDLLDDGDIDLSVKDGRLAVYYEDTPEGEAEANKYAKAICAMVDNGKEVLYAIEQMEW